MKMYQSDYMIITSLAVALVLPGVSAHVALWNKGMFGFNWPNQVGDNVTNWNNNKAINPLREFEGLGIEQWFGHGYKNLPPADGDFMILPAGGTYQGEVWCGRGGTTYRDPKVTTPLPVYACSTEGQLHVENTFGQPVDESKFGGTAIAIAYTSDVASLQPNDMTVISVNYRSVWEREIGYDIPAGLPPCPEGGCLCTWNWIHQPMGYANEIYNNLYRCQVSGATGSAPVQRGQVPRECGSNPAACVNGPKTPMYIYQAQGNNIPRQFPPPIYRSNWGFQNGAQNDIFVAGSSPAPTTYLDNAYATGTATTGTTPSPTATALPTGWVDVGCVIDDSNFRVLNGGVNAMTNLTVEACVASCAAKGSIFAGVEAGNECWCGSRMQGTGAPASECDARCKGDQWAFCGGRYRINVYRSPAAPTTYAAAPTPIAISALPVGWASLGCYDRGTAVQALDGGMVTIKDATVAKCLDTCAGKGMAWAGLEYGSQCWCGKSSSLVAATSGCNVRCSGDDTVACGGTYRINLFHADVLPTLSSSSSITVATTKATTTTTSSTTAKATTTTTSTTNKATTTTTSSTTAKANNTATSSTTTKASTTTTSSTMTKATTTTTSSTTIKASSTTSKTSTTSPISSPTPLISLPTGWRSLGCFADSSITRVLNGSFLESSTSTTPQSCMAFCRSRGFAYAGVQYGRQCYCGNSMTSSKVTPSECTRPCTGDKSLVCGGNYRMNIYNFSPSTIKERDIAAQATLVAEPTVIPSGEPSSEGRRYPLPMSLRRSVLMA